MKISPQLVQFGIGFFDEAITLFGQSGILKPSIAATASSILQLLNQAIAQETQQTPQATLPAQTPVEHSLIEG